MHDKYQENNIHKLCFQNEATHKAQKHGGLFKYSQGQA